MSLKPAIANFVLALSLFFASFYLAWQVSATTNFFYSTWYEVLKIDLTISKYAPNNKFNKKGFENLPKAEHVRLFSGIAKAIQQKGDGLRDLHYKNTSNKQQVKLLTEAEVVHLQDVANLTGVFKYLGVFGVLISLLLFVLMHFAIIPVAKFKNLLIGGVGSVLAIILLVIIIGPTKVFYAGHELVFPNNHQWFFYYEDSLMSTMMKAPALFGPIAGQLLFLTVVFWLAALFFSREVSLSLKRLNHD